MHNLVVTLTLALTRDLIKILFFSKYGNVTYKIKGNEIHIDIQEKMFVLAHTINLELG